MPPTKAYERMEYEYEYATHRTHQIQHYDEGKHFSIQRYVLIFCFVSRLYLVYPILLFLLVTGGGHQYGLGFRVYGRSIPL